MPHKEAFVKKIVSRLTNIGEIFMNLKKKSIVICGIFVLLFLINGITLMYRGNDAIALAIEKKDGILTAEQVKLSFDSVSGRLIKEDIKEGQEVKKGDIIMQLDSTDTDLSIEKTKAQIAQLDAQINSQNGAINVEYAMTDTQEVQTFNQIDQQKAAIASAQATYKNKQIDYNRKLQLLEVGAIAQSDLDDAKMALDVASADLAQQQELLNQLLGGANDNANTQAINLPTINQQRQEIDNKLNDVEALIEQKKQLEVQLKELEVTKSRLTLYAPEDGKIIKILAKQGEMISANTPVVLLESNRRYYDIYISENQVANLAEGDTINGKSIANDLIVPGTIRLITQAPGFADLKQSREKGQADLSAFQIRIYTDDVEGLQTGMTIEVTDDEFTKR